ncbi:fibrobacter succinogenes major paralogous domain-containing protein [Flavobacteriales bacterium]|nr:fibrobacter succinogenes major paralogous domain-containing protein [Flavobacteriales bacterium]
MKAFLLFFSFLLCLSFSASAQDDCSLPGDLTGDSLVTVNDLMALLGFYGSDYTVTASTEGCSSVEHFGYTYEVVQLGDQCWFAENLRTAQYLNGDSLLLANADGYAIEGWSGAVDTSGVCITPGYSGGDSDALWNWEQFGFLYSKLTITDPRALCPTGWHIPHRPDWDYVSTIYPVANGLVEPGSYEESLGTWFNSAGPNCGTNLYGFGARAGGYIAEYFSGVGYSAVFWSIDGSNFRLERWDGCGPSDEIFVGGNTGYPGYGAAIRCLQD